MKVRIREEPGMEVLWFIYTDNRESRITEVSPSFCPKGEFLHEHTHTQKGREGGRDRERMLICILISILTTDLPIADFFVNGIICGFLCVGPFIYYTVSKATLRW